MALHRNLTATDGIHIVQAYEYADATARLAATGFVPGDIGKLARQADDGSFWILSSDSPITWLGIGGSYLNNPMTSVGDFIVGTTAGAPARLAGSAGGYIRSAGTGGPPTITRAIDADSVIASTTVGASPDSSAILQADSTTKGFLMPRMTEAQRDAIASPAAGLTVYVPLTKRVWFFDGFNWRKAATDVTRIVTVAVDGSGDFTSIQDAIDSITTATDADRWVVEVAPGEYIEDVAMADYIQVFGFGWDTLISGQITCTALDYTQLNNCRVEYANGPALVVSMNVDGEVNVTDCFLFSTYDDTVAPAVVRCTVQATKGILYVYKESEVTLTVNDTVHNSETTLQTVWYLYGSDEVYLENYGTYNYIETDNGGNTLSLIYSVNTNANTRAIFRLGQFEVEGSGTHNNPVRILVLYQAAGIIGANNVRCQVYLPSGSPILIFSDVQQSQAAGGTANCTNCSIIPAGAFVDSDIFIGRATTVNDTVQASATLFDLTADVKPGRETTGGSAGTFLYSVVNNFGTQWSTGLFNGAEVNADVTDWANVSAALGGQAGANLYVFRSDGAGGGAMVPNTQTIFNYLTVGKSGDVDYTTIKAAVDYAIAQGCSATDPWEIKVYPGTYSESPMNIVPGIILVSSTNRIDTVFVTAAESDEDLFTCTGGYFGGLNVSGVTDSGKCLWRCATAYSLVVFHGITFKNCSTGIHCSNGASTIHTNNSINLNGAGQSITTAYLVTGSSSYMGHSGGFFNVPSAILPAYAANPVQTVFRVADSARFTISSATANIAYKTTDADVLLADGGSNCTILACEIRNSGTGAHIGSSGTGTTLVIQAGVWVGNNLNGSSESSTGVFLVSAASDVLGFSAVPGTVLSGLIQVLSESRTYIAGTVSYQFLTQKTADFEGFFHDQQSTGLAYGGEVTAGSGLNASVAEGHGWISRHTPYHDSFDVEWDADTAVSLTASSTNYVVYDSVSDSLLSQLTAPSNLQVQLAVVVTDGSGIRFIHTTRNVVHDSQYLLYSYLVDTRKIAWKTGLAVSQGTSARKLEISSGSWYRTTDLLSVTGGTDVTFSYFYGSNGTTEVASQTELSITQYDNAGTLTAMTSGYFRADTVIVTSDGRFSVIYGTDEFATALLASDVDNKASMPTFMAETGCFLFMVIVEQGVGIDSFVDVRPDPNAATAAGGGGGGTGDHSALTNLDKPGDHTWAMLVDGTRAMSGDLNMGTNAISNVGTVDGVDVSGHASRHNPGGADALATAVPSALQVGVSPGAGSNASYALSDHQHGSATPGTPAAIAVSGSAGTGTVPALSTHVHAHGNQTTATHHAVCTTGANGFMSSTDKTKLDGIATGATNLALASTAPVNVTKAAAAVGTGTTAARADHKHDITTAIAGATTPGATAAEGTATSLARSDHAHSLAAFGTTAGTFCQGNDARLSDNRTDANAIHKNVANEISTITEKVTPVSADLIIIEDSAASGVKKRVQVGNLPGGGTPAVFGTYFQQWSNEVSATNGTTSWVNHQNRTTATLAAGTYRIGWYATGRLDNVSNDLEFQVLVDSAAVGEYKAEQKDNGPLQRNSFSGFVYITLLAATHTIQFQFRTSNATYTAQCWQSRLEIWRVS